MSDFDVFDDSDHLPPDHLLDELESIKDILKDGDTAQPSDIPLLDDMVIGNLEDNARLLNLNRIFEEDTDTEDEPETVKPARPDVKFPRFQLDTMLDEVAEEPIAAAKPIVAAPPVQKAPPTAPRVRPDYSREVLIQEIVDEFIPQIEAALRARLGGLDDATLKRWQEPE